ncbi:MAG: HAMP domain-containing histidine kinase, partial [Flavobacteriales bacterium]|nr:HAMP domain-containing histidine kinase [Flavobacteriales bacterium]
EDVVIQVTDTGIGISEDDQAGLFGAFFRTTNPEALSESGTGLGLAIVASIAERHSGRVEVESLLGEGTTFTVALPAAPR